MLGLPRDSDEKIRGQTHANRDGDCVLTPAEKGRDVVWVSWGGANAPPKKIFAPPKDSLGGGKIN